MSIPVSKTLDEIRSDLFSKINEIQEEYSTNGWLPTVLNLNKGIARGMIEIWAWGLYQLYQFLFMVLEQILIDNASGAWLELLCRIVDIERKGQTKATGIVKFTRESSSGNVPIAAGRIVKTLPDGAGNVYRYVTTEEVVMQDGQTEVTVSAESEEYGSAANAVAGQISEIATTIPGVDAVTNDSDWLTSEGADEEDDDSLRERYKLKWKANNGCTKYAYESWALAVTGVAAARIMDQHPRGQGTVDVIVKGTAGVPTAELLTSVDANVQENVPVNDDALTLGVTQVDVSLSGNLVLNPGTVIDTIESDVQTKLTALFASVQTDENIVPFDIGEDVTLDRMVAVIMTVPGIKKIEWTLPADDIAVADEGLAVLISSAFTTSFAESD